MMGWPVYPLTDRLLAARTHGFEVATRGAAWLFLLTQSSGCVRVAMSPPARVSYALILCGFKDIGIPDTPTPYFLDGISQSLSSYWRDVSFTQVDLGLSEVFGWYTMQYSFFHSTNTTRGTWISEAKRLANQSGVDLSKYYGVIAAINSGTGLDEGDLGLDVAVQVPGFFGQNYWHWCKKCQVLFFALNSLPRPCPAGGNHDDTGSYDYSLALNQPGFQGGQSDWRWCDRCQGLNYGGGVGVCPAGGQHQNSPLQNYTLNFAPVNFVGQDNWKWCDKCQCLAYANTPPGRCAAGGTHNSTGNDYVLVHSLGDSSFNLTFLGHETGHTMGLGHSFLGNPETDYGNPWDIMSAMRVHYIGSAPYSPAGPGANAPNLDYLGWLPGELTWTPAHGIGGSETIQLRALSNLGLGFMAAKLTKAESTYYAEYRQPTAWDAAVPGQAVFINEDRTWLWCRKCQELTLAVASPPGPCAGGGQHDHTGSVYYTLYHQTWPGKPGQSGWLWCNKCQALAFTGNSSGVCSAGGQHSFLGSNNYTLVSNPVSFGGQSNWRWCSKCQTLNYAGGPSPGPCPAGGGHDNSTSSDYALIAQQQRHSFLIGDPSGNVQWQPGMVFVDKPRSLAIVIHSFDPSALATISITNAQNLWKWCNKCQGMAYSDSGTLGVCPAGNVHDHTGSSDYSLLYGLPGSAAQSNWRWCSKCQGLAFAGNSASVCPAGDGHSSIGSADYALLYDTTMASAQSNWRWCSKCQGLAFAGNSAGVCPAGDGHSSAGSADYNAIDV
jgi:hypothetical protein